LKHVTDFYCSLLGTTSERTIFLHPSFFGFLC
jgi:hypothetical protein